MKEDSGRRTRHKYPPCILYQLDDGMVIAEDTQGDAVRAFKPVNRNDKVNFEDVIISWLHSSEYSIIEIEDEEDA